eukprot:Amastigsp_a846600_46.p3 type:complete len:183 gc:universal Amastigsp_a846600_46:658-1206(+)
MSRTVSSRRSSSCSTSRSPTRGSCTSAPSRRPQTAGRSSRSVLPRTGRPSSLARRTTSTTLLRICWRASGLPSRTASAFTRLCRSTRSTPSSSTSIGSTATSLSSALRWDVSASARTPRRATTRSCSAGSARSSTSTTRLSTRRRRSWPSSLRTSPTSSATSRTRTSLHGAMRSACTSASGP